MLEPSSVIATSSTSGALKLFQSVADRLGRALSGPARTAAIKGLARLQGYSSYLDETNDRVSTFKSFANPTMPVSLLDHFVTTVLSNTDRKRSLDQDDVVTRIVRPARLVISATAGYGKSMLMRFISLSLFENPRGRIPIFIELRELNRVKNPDLKAYIHAAYKRTSAIQLEAFEYGLEVGVFALLLDGFDELNHEIRLLIEAQILELSRSYKQVSIVVSGRPDDRFLSWRSFTVLKICPMAKEQVIELINKLDYDRGTKKRFIQKINKGLFETHQSFLSTPLLAILMLLTFEENANIPDKMHLFYAKAFETLFHKHDAMKEQYDRQRKSRLRIDEFEKVFSVFCLKTYVQEKIEFNRVELISSVGDALSFEDKEINSEDFLFDLEEAVCLLQREGTSYFFVHRSFQEYFTAVFLSSCPEDIRDEFINQVASRHWDNVLPMLFDMASPQLEPSWVVIKTDEYLSEVGHEGGKIAPLFAKWLGIGFRATSDSVYLSHFVHGNYSKYISIMRRFYPDKIKSDVRIEFDLIEREMTRLLRAGKLPTTGLPKKHAGHTSTINVLFEKFPETVLGGSGLLKYANEEYSEIVTLREEIDQSQKAKSDFLKKLFAKQSRH